MILPKSLLYSLFSGLLALTLPCRAELIFEENFEALNVGSELSNQADWKASPYGHHPANYVVDDASYPERSQFLRGPGGGDHYNKIRLPAAAKESLAQAPIIWFSAIHLGDVGLYLEPIRATFGDQSKIKLPDTVLNGMGEKVKTKGWVESLLMLVKQEPGDYRVMLGRRVAGEDGPFSMDPLFNSASSVAADQLKLNKIDSLLMRLDGFNAVDNIRLGTSESLASLPFEIVIPEKIETVYEPILEHVLPPRKAWNLGGAWRATATPASQTEIPQQGSSLVVVPGKHASLFGKDTKAVWFEREFVLPQKEHNKRYELCFERVTDQCEVYINQQKVGAGVDGYFPFRIDVTKQIKAGNNTVTVKVYAPTAETVVGKRPQGLSWLYSMYTGIPYPVHLEATSIVSIEDVYVTTKVDPQNIAQAEVEVTNWTKHTVNGYLTAKVYDTDFAFEAQEVSLKPGQTKVVTFRKEWKNPRLWNLHDPHLYFMDINFIHNEQVEDAYRQRFGFREITVKGPDFFLNGNKTLQRRDSALVYWGTEATHRERLSILRERGFNGLRLHMNPSWRMTRICDEEGFLVSPEGGICSPHGHEVEEAFWPAARAHLTQMVKLMRSSPSVMYWSLSNEFAAYYMKGSTSEKAVVDNHMVSIGEEMAQMDPTRIWTCSGDGELGGVGQHGPAPALSFHYAWQPTKQHNTLPMTANWLEQRLTPWQGIIWDRTKPIMLSEDIHPPYALNIPDGMTAWGGDKTYDMQTGVYEAWHAVFEMLAPAHYRAGVSVWNPWATAASTPENRLYELGPLMPTYLIAPQELSTGLRAGSVESRTFDLFNKSTQSIQTTLKLQLSDDSGNTLESGSIDINIEAGEMKTCSFDLTAPMGGDKQKLQLDLKLLDLNSGELYAQESIDYTVYPTSPLVVPANCVFVSEDAELLPDVKFTLGRYTTISEGLKQHPSSMVIAKLQLNPQDAKQLNEAVLNGLKVLMIETVPSGQTPARIDQNKVSSFAFIRDEGDPAIDGLEEADLRLWRPGLEVSSQGYLKSLELDYDIILDTGGSNGMTHSPLIRVYAGHGYYLLCQLKVVSAFEKEPAAAYVFQKLLTSFSKVVHSPTRLAAVLTEQEELAHALEIADVEYASIDPNEDSSMFPLLLLGATDPLSTPQLELMKKRAEAGLDTMLHNVSAENLAILKEQFNLDVSWEPAFDRQLLRQPNSKLAAGLSNTDLCWYDGSDFYKKVNAEMVGKSVPNAKSSMISGVLQTESLGVDRPFEPAAVLKIPFGKGNLILSTVLWEQFQNTQTVKSKTLIHRLLRNLGCRTILNSNQLTSYQPLNLNSVANRSFWSQPETGVEAWFGDAKDDLRYFPVNVTGYDPYLRMDQPPEPFPTGLMNFAGIDFSIIDPAKNNGSSCIVIAPGEFTSIQLQTTGKAIWMLGALANHQPKGQKSAQVIWKYKDSSLVTVDLHAGEQLNGYQYMTPITEGICAWTGPTPTRTDAVLWAWRVVNPRPEEVVMSVELVAKNTSLGVIAVSVEQ